MVRSGDEWKGAAADSEFGMETGRMTESTDRRGDRAKRMLHGSRMDDGGN